MTSKGVENSVMKQEDGKTLPVHLPWPCPSLQCQGFWDLGMKKLLRMLSLSERTGPGEVPALGGGKDAAPGCL